MFTYLQIADLPYNQTCLGLAAFGHNNLESLCSSIRQRLRSLIYDADVSRAASVRSDQLGVVGYFSTAVPQIADLLYNKTSPGLVAFGHNNWESLCSSIRQRLKSLIYDADVSEATRFRSD